MLVRLQVFNHIVSYFVIVLQTVSRSGVFKFHNALYFCLDTHRTERHSRHCSDLGSHPGGVCASVPESRRSHVHIFVRRAHRLCVPGGWSHQQTRRIRQARFPGTLLHVAYDILCRLPSKQMLYFRLESVTTAIVRKRFLKILWHVLIHTHLKVSHDGPLVMTTSDDAVKHSTALLYNTHVLWQNPLKLQFVDHELIPARNASLPAMQGSASGSNVRYYPTWKHSPLKQINDQGCYNASKLPDVFS
jgi:hypothetical protein